MPSPVLLAQVADVPAPLWLVTFLHGLTFVLHMASMNLMLGGAWHLATGVGGRRVASALPPLFSFTVTLGVAPLLFLQLVHGERFYASSIQMGWLWLGILLVLMLAYYAAYACEGRAKAGRAAPAWLRAAPLAGLLVFSFVLSANVALSEHPAVLSGLEDPGTNLPVTETGVWLRWSHTIVGAIAFGSLLLLILAHGRHGKDAAEAEALTRRGALTACVATGISVLLGVGQLLQSTDHIGGALPGIGLVIGIGAGLAVPIVMLLYWKRPTTARLLLACGLGLVALAGKTVLRFAMRASRLEGVEDPVVTAPMDFGPIALFIVCLLIAVGMLVWLGRLALDARASEEVR